MDDEPTLGLGIGAALMLVQKKGIRRLQSPKHVLVIGALFRGEDICIYTLWYNYVGLIESDKKERKFAGGLSLPETVKIIDEEKMRWWFIDCFGHISTGCWLLQIK